MRYDFTKMQALGNDFVIFDARKAPFSLPPGDVKKVADRHLGIGCDQLIILRESGESGAAASMHIYNADGSEAEACGNGTACVAKLLMSESSSQQLVLQVGKRELIAKRTGRRIDVDMGVPLWKPDEIPVDWNQVCDKGGDLLHEIRKNFSIRCVNMGNPHVVLWPKETSMGDDDVKKWGEKIENHPMFPRGTNVEFVWVVHMERLRMRVWERGCGITLACGSGACAALVASAKEDLCKRGAGVFVDGGPLTEEGTLWVHWRNDDHVVMDVLTNLSFRGSIDLPDSSQY